MAGRRPDVASVAGSVAEGLGERLSTGLGRSEEGHVVRGTGTEETRGGVSVDRRAQDQSRVSSWRQGPLVLPVKRAERG